jgi:tripartite ATP-independent transporter DctM subunit
VLFNAAETTAIVMLLVAAAAVSAWLITIADFPGQVVGLLEPMIDSPRLLMAMIMLIVFLVGMPMDLTPTVLILVPVLMPLVDAAGIDPVYFGVMFILNCSIGLITPPVGNVLNVIAGVSRLPFEQCAVGVLPYLTGLIILLILFLIFPALVTVPASWLIG